MRTHYLPRAMRDKLETADRREQARNGADMLRRRLDDELRDWHAWTWRRERTLRRAEDVRVARNHARWQQLAQARAAQSAAQPAQAAAFAPDSRQ